MGTQTASPVISTPLTPPDLSTEHQSKQATWCFHGVRAKLHARCRDCRHNAACEQELYNILDNYDPELIFEMKRTINYNDRRSKAWREMFM